LGSRLHALADDGSVPFLPGWQYVFTPGHTPGHISLFRTSDKILIAGDAFVTTKQESAIATLASIEILSGPPKYFTPDWIAAKDSVIKLRDLEPDVAATGHGKPMRGESLKQKLGYLAAHFNKIAVPAFGRYVKERGIISRSGKQFIPPVKLNPYIIASLIGFIGMLTVTLYKRRVSGKHPC
jgi:glyoxylase-like metal-dependent hydrolase (beta-lactamase superfamily II)